MVSNLISVENNVLFSFLFLVEEDFDGLQEVSFFFSFFG